MFTANKTKAATKPKEDKLILREIKIEIDLPKIDFSKVLTNLFKTPLKEYKNSNPVNEEPTSVGILPNELWLTLYNYLDSRSLTKFISTCKKLMEIANDDPTREKLYKARENHRKVKFLSSLSDRRGLLDVENRRSSVIPAELLRQFVTPYQPVKINWPQEEVYKDDPQSGFRMKNPK